MNKVKMNKINGQKTTLGQIVLRNNPKGPTAFIGRCGKGPDNELYLVTYDTIFLATNPFSAWDTPVCSVYINKFVDIEITVVGDTKFVYL